MSQILLVPNIPSVRLLLDSLVKKYKLANKTEDLRKSVQIKNTLSRVKVVKQTVKHEMVDKWMTHLNPPLNYARKVKALLTAIYNKLGSSGRPYNKKNEVILLCTKNPMINSNINNLLDLLYNKNKSNIKPQKLKLIKKFINHLKILKVDFNRQDITNVYIKRK